MSALPVANESEATFSRYTKGGRKLTYSLRVLQEPQRARACGSGAKSSADRRPVDPPPVIELKVFEGEQKTDITFNHKANFFIFVTLENARPIAQARGQPAAQPPVLTGSPVSGAALLDRPSPAAYFIFPDLSVRHEGKYRLSFNLYEELKDAADEDATPMMPTAPGMLPMMAQAAVRFRMEVRSKPFIVYSAKKFPGLTESTTLSRVVAEQGCRVRIRRDVRMRRRENKGSKDGSDRDDGSYSSYSDPISAGGDPYRQSSIEQQQQQQHTPSSAIESGYYASSSSSYPTPTYTHAQVPQYAPPARPSSQHQHYHSSSAPDASSVSSNHYSQPYGAYAPPPHSSHTRHPSSVSSHESLLQSYQAGPPPAQQAPPPPPPPPAPLSGAPPTSYGQLPPESQTNSARSSYPEFDSVATCSKYSDQMAYGRVAIDNNYQTPIPPAPYAADNRSATPGGHSLPPLKSLPAVDARHETSPSYGGVPDIYNMGAVTGASLAASIRAGSKRGYERTFDAGLGISMSNGARPTAAGQDVPQIETDEGLVDVDELLGMKTLSYRRANGSLQTKKIPSPSEVC